MLRILSLIEIVVPFEVPAVVEGLLESQHRGKGLDFTEMVAMVAVIEQIIVDESLEHSKVPSNSIAPNEQNNTQ
eukprot:547363-Amphidinium_carterae.1